MPTKDALELAKRRCVCPNDHQTGQHLTESEVDAVCLSLISLSAQLERAQKLIIRYENELRQFGWTQGTFDAYRKMALADIGPSHEPKEWQIVGIDGGPDGTVESEAHADEVMEKWPGAYRKQWRIPAIPAGPWMDIRPSEQEGK